jgi:predicted secreted protein
MKSLFVAAAAMVMIAGSVSAQETQSAEQEPPQERKICRTEKATGSLTRRTRVCLTEAQWRELNDRTRRGVDEMNRAASGGKQCAQDPSGGC